MSAVLITRLRAGWARLSIRSSSITPLPKVSSQTEKDVFVRGAGERGSFFAPETRKESKRLRLINVPSPELTQTTQAGWARTVVMAAWPCRRLPNPLTHRSPLHRQWQRARSQGTFTGRGNRRRGPGTRSTGRAGWPQKPFHPKKFRN